MTPSPPPLHPQSFELVDAVRHQDVDSLTTWLMDSAAPKLLWVDGPPGSGRTTTVARALMSPGVPTCPCRRLRCYAGMPVAEVLEALGDLLQHAGNESLNTALTQRTAPLARVAVALRGLRDTEVVLWLDDFEEMLNPLAEAYEDELTPVFLEGCRTLGPSAGRVIFVADCPAPGNALTTHSLTTLPEDEGAQLWNAAARNLAPDGAFELPKLTDFPIAWREQPLSVYVLVHAIHRLDATGVEGLLASPQESSVEALCDTIFQALPTAATRALVGLAAFPPEPSRQALRDISDLLGESGEEPLNSRALVELAGWGLLRRHDVATMKLTFQLQHALRTPLTARLIRSVPEAWKEAQAAAANYYLTRSTKTQSIWDAVKAWSGYSSAGLGDKAYETQSRTLPALLQGGQFAMARHMLGASLESLSGARRTVVMGNLAMIHKSTGEYDEAEKLYSKVHSSCVENGDMVNAARTLHQLGNTQYARGDFRRALRSYEKSLDLSTRLEQHAVASATWIQVGNTLYQCGETEAALETYLSALERVAERKDEVMQAALEVQIGQIHLEAQRYAEAEAHLKRAGEFSRSCGDLRNLLKAQVALGLARRKQRDYDTARGCYDEAFETAYALGDGLEAATARILAGELEKDRSQFGASIQCHLEARNLLDMETLSQAGPEGSVFDGHSRQLKALRERVDTALLQLRDELGVEMFERLARSGT
jgi:tetratricopeptide (TPR) repeat protein